ncbi:glycosyltransferase family 4 protein [Luteolibacter flavescens]|uniref:Glycosyltransferase family 4 protein n=1 Tax=Luteolibacter flavescens TaxID=1859460 RepID=A0ABT3FPI8_9BACT|nr:glycosyltransferase family 4 protein [Luteolibacter flavescens]MCW1885171.1 glycosyltransferase family 4 protein [Luteolibacter flavescens]
MPLRIAIIADFPWASLDGSATGRGGGQGCTWLPQLAENFERHPDLEIHWISLDRRGAGGESVRKYGQHFVRLKGTSVSVDLALGCLPTRRTMRKYLRALKPDIVHAWGTESIYPVALRDFKGPTILSMQGVLTEYKRIGGLPDDWRWRRMIAGEAAMIRSATIVTCESGWGMAKVKEVVPTAHCRMVEYGVHPRFFDVPWQPDAAKPYVLYVGGTGTRKGFDLLLDALAHIPDRKWELRLAGDDAMRAEVERRGLKDVECLGLLAWDEMEKQLRGAWASVLPTRGDTSPNSVKEARVIGVPVITSRHGGQAGYIRDGENGRLVDPLTDESLAEALTDVMSSHDRAIALGHGRHQEDRDYLSAERTAKGFADIYRELAKGGGPR